MNHVFSCRVGAAPCRCADSWINRCRRCQDSNPRGCKPEYCSCACHKSGAPYGPRLEQDSAIGGGLVLAAAVLAWYVAVALVML